MEGRKGREEGTAKMQTINLSEEKREVPSEPPFDLPRTVYVVFAWEASCSLPASVRCLAWLAQAVNGG